MGHARVTTTVVIYTHLFDVVTVAVKIVVN